MNRPRLLLLCVLNLALLFLLARRIGFEKTATSHEALRDAIIGYGPGNAVSAAILTVMGIIDDQLTASTMVAKIALQAVPASIGALPGRSQPGEHSDMQDDQEGETGYRHELFMMMVGVLFLSLNVAPTDEMILIAYKITPFHTACIMLISISLMQGFVYALYFKGSHGVSEGMQWWQSFIRFTTPGCIIALAASIYALWTFERLDHTSLPEIMTSAAIPGFPASIGAASARLIL